MDEAGKSPPHPDSLSSAARRLALAGGILMTMQSLSQRGGEKVGIILANGFADAGIPVRIALVRDSGDAESELRRMLHKDVSVSTAGRRLPVPFRKQFERLRAVPFIRREIRAFAPGVVLATVNTLGMPTALSRGRRDAPPAFALKLTNRLARPDMLVVQKMFRRKSFEFIFGRLDLVLTLSDAERQMMGEFYPGRLDLFHTVPNPYVSNDMLSGPPARRRRPGRILAAGRMVRQKRFDVLLDAFAQCRNTDRLTILGEGPLRPKLERAAAALGIADRVEMPGFREDLVPWMQASDLLVLSSDYEGLPAVAVEALACGLPVVTTDCFGSAYELLAGLEGCAVVPIGDAARLANAIDQSTQISVDASALRRRAVDYVIDASVAAHIIELAKITYMP